MANSTDVIKLVTVNHEETRDRLVAIEKRLDGVEEQVKYTNGRVSRLEQRNSNNDAVEADREKRGAQPSPNPKAKLDYKTISAIAIGAAIFIGTLWQVLHGGLIK